MHSLSIAVLGFSLAAILCAVLAQRQAPEVSTIEKPVAINLNRFLDGLETLIAGDATAVVPIPESINASDRERLDSAIASVRSLLGQSRTRRPEKPLEPVEPSAAPVVKEAPNSSFDDSAQRRHLAKLSQRLEQLAAQLLASTSASEENRDSTQEQLGALKLQARKLSDRSRQLGDNVDLLKDLAEQSGVLALNAAIQASRSGEDGLGIIADELQRVANRHSDAGRQIEENLQQLNGDLNETNKVIDTGRQHLQQGQHDTSELRRHIAELARTCAGLRQGA